MTRDHGSEITVQKLFVVSYSLIVIERKEIKRTKVWFDLGLLRHSDWRKSKEFVEQRAELYRRSYRFNATQPHEQRPQIGRRGSLTAGSRATLANHWSPDQLTR